MVMQRIGMMSVPRPAVFARDAEPPCGKTSLPPDGLVDGEMYCHAGVHYTGAVHYSDDIIRADYVERCPTVRAAAVRARIGAERRRLANEIARVELLSPCTWQGFNPFRENLMGGDRALTVMMQFARQLDSNVLMVGPKGLGKSHLLLASHFELLGRGVPSVYIRTPELRRLFRALDNYDDEVAGEARQALEPILYAQAVHFDDAGHIEDDERARGQFTEGLKDLLDRGRGRWATATNRNSREAEAHPDLSGAIVSRLMLDAEVVKMDGVDFRALTARVA